MRQIRETHFFLGHWVTFRHFKSAKIAINITTVGTSSDVYFLLSKDDSLTP